MTDRRHVRQDVAKERRHGTRGMYRRGCRCLLCSAANAEYVASWRRLKAKGHVFLGARIDAGAFYRLLRLLLLEGFQRPQIQEGAGFDRMPDWRHTRRITVRSYRRLQHFAQPYLIGDSPDASLE